MVDTVLINQETIYAPRHGSDRLLDLEGSLNEYELDLLQGSAGELTALVRVEDLRLAVASKSVVQRLDDRSF